MQIFYWRANPGNEIEVASASSAAPFLAVKCLNQLIQDSSKFFPETAINICRFDICESYFDNFICGGYSVKETREAIGLDTQASNILKAASLNLTKWCWNSQEFLFNLKTDSISCEKF